MKKLNLNLAFVLALGMLPFASQAVEVTVLGGMNMASDSLKYVNTATITYSTATKSSAQMAAGVLIDFPAAMNIVSVETGLFYKKAKQTSTVTGTNGGLSASVPITFETTRLQIPLLIRLVKLPIVSFGVGGFWETGIGGVKSTTTAGTQNGSYGALGVYAPDYGLLGDIRFTLPVAPKIGIVLDANYSLGLAERSRDKPTYSYKSSALAVLGGVKIAL